MLLPGAYTREVADHGPDPGQPAADRVRPEGVQDRQAELQHPLRPAPGRHADGPDGVPDARRGRAGPATCSTASASRPRRRAFRSGCSTAWRRDIPDAILDMAVTHGADMLLLGTTRRGTLWKAMKGDVIQAVAEQLPEGSRPADPRVTARVGRDDRSPSLGRLVGQDRGRRDEVRTMSAQDRPSSTGSGCRRLRSQAVASGRLGEGRTPTRSRQELRARRQAVETSHAPDGTPARPRREAADDQDGRKQHQAGTTIRTR